MKISPSDRGYQKRAFTVTIYVDGKEVVNDTTLSYEEDVAIMKVCAAVLLEMMGLDVERPLGLSAIELGKIDENNG